MRIIAGEFRGRNLLSPEGQTTRPVTDRVKQSLFDILSPHIEDARIYDCFAGTGSMGLECLSRGAHHATFFESDRSAVEQLKKNIHLLGVTNRSTVVSSEIFNWFSKTEKPQTLASLIFLDPPYRFLRERPADLQSLAATFAKFHMNHESQVIFRHDSTDSLPLPPLIATDIRTYGSMTLEFLSLKT